MSVADTAAELAPGQALKIRDIEVQARRMRSPRASTPAGVRAPGNRA